MLDVTLRDGSAAVVLPLRHEDRDLLAAEFHELSPETARQRFLSPINSLSDAMLDHLVNDVDFIDHVAYFLAVETAPGEYDPVAIARMIRYEDVPTTADVAVTVKDAHQGRGIASVLLDVLAENRPEGVERLLTEVQVGNTASLAMLKRLGPMSVEPNGYGAFEVGIELYAAGAVDPTEEPATPEPSTAGIPISRPRPEQADGERSRPRMDRRKQAAFQSRDSVCPWLNAG